MYRLVVVERLADGSVLEFAERPVKTVAACKAAMTSRLTWVDNRNYSLEATGQPKVVGLSGRIEVASWEEVMAFEEFEVGMC